MLFQPLFVLVPSLTLIPCIPGLVKDDTKQLKDLKLGKNSKMMLVGTTMSDLVAVTTKPSVSEIAATTGGAVVNKKEPISKQKVLRPSSPSVQARGNILYRFGRRALKTIY